jgi:hypothetical protein
MAARARTCEALGQWLARLDTLGADMSGAAEHLAAALQAPSSTRRIVGGLVAAAWAVRIARLTNTVTNPLILAATCPSTCAAQRDARVSAQRGDGRCVCRAERPCCCDAVDSTKPDCRVRRSQERSWGPRAAVGHAGAGAQLCDAGVPRESASYQRGDSGLGRTRAQGGPPGDTGGLRFVARTSAGDNGEGCGAMDPDGAER